MKTIEKLMEQGWNIIIECKAKGRTYGMTYEASGSRETARFGHQIHAVGETIAELEDVLEHQANEVDKFESANGRTVQVFASAYFPIKDTSLADSLLTAKAQQKMGHLLAHAQLSDVSYKDIEVRREEEEVYVYVSVDCKVKHHVLQSENDILQEAEKIVSEAIEQDKEVMLGDYDAVPLEK